MKGQIGLVVVAVMLIATMLLVLLAAEVVSRESVTSETVVQTQLTVTEFKIMAALNAILHSEDPSIKRYVRSGEGDREKVKSMIKSIFKANKGQSDNRDYYFAAEGVDLEIGSDQIITKSIYVASPQGPKLIQVGASRRKDQSLSGVGVAE